VLILAKNWLLAPSTAVHELLELAQQWRDLVIRVEMLQASRAPETVLSVARLVPHSGRSLSAGSKRNRKTDRAVAPLNKLWHKMTRLRAGDCYLTTVLVNVDSVC
jgi:hypothetical protein